MNRLTFRIFVLVMLLVAAGGVSWAGASSHTISLQPIGAYATGIFDESAAEIVAYDAGTQRLFVINSQAATVDVLDVSDPTTPAKLFEIDATAYGAGANSVDVNDGLVAVAIEADPKTDPGVVVFFDTDGNYLNQVTVGALPDMLTFTPDGRYLLVANEGEPNDDYTIDPEGSVSIINVSRGVALLSQRNVHTADFTRFNNRPLPHGVRVFGPGASVAQDLEPEYIAVSPDSRLAYVALQENNAIAEIDIRRAEVKRLIGLGFKDHSLPGNGLDVSDRDDAINIANWPVYGIYQPDAIAAFEVRGRTFIISANEGDARDYDTFSEEARVRSLDLDPVAFPDADDLQKNENLGRLTVTTTEGDVDGDGLYEELYAFGARSFSIWTRSGALVYDSGDDFEQITAAAIPDFFNANNDDNDSFDSRSDNKGPEPEGVAVGEVNGRIYAFIGLERVGGIMVYDVSNPYAPTFVQYVNNRDFSVDAESPAAGDLGPEGLTFIAADDSPNGKPLLVVGSEVSGTTTIFQITP